MLEAVWASTECAEAGSASAGCVEAGSAAAERAAAAAEWAWRQFSEVELGDVRRTRRVVKLAAQMATQPQASWPKQAGSWAATKAGYRLFDNHEVTFEALQRQHREQTRAMAGTRPVVLHVQDGSQVDFSGPRAREGLGPIGDGGGWGFLLHTTLTVDPQKPAVLGLSQQTLAVRRPAPPQESKRQRKRRRRESEVWGQSVAALGMVPAGSRWVQVCDREADTFAFFATCQQYRHRFLVRAAQNRRAALGHAASEPGGGLLDLARSLPAGASKEVELRRRAQRVPRRVLLNVAWSPVATRIALLAVVAVRLLQLKHTARQAPQRPALMWAAETRSPRPTQAAEVPNHFDLTPDHVRVLAAYRGRSAETLTVYEFWREVAKLGGFLARRSDGEPGWQTLWRGWRDLDLMTHGARLALADVPRCG